MVTQSFNNQCTKKGGFVTYVRNNFNINNVKHIDSFESWEGLFVDIHENENMNNVVTIGLPCYEKYCYFFQKSDTSWRHSLTK